jgi:hypothetical protein
MILTDHIRFFAPTDGLPLLNKYEVPLGNWGVMIFLFISGILLMGSKCSNSQELKKFIIKKRHQDLPIILALARINCHDFGYFHSE